MTEPRPDPLIATLGKVLTENRHQFGVMRSVRAAIVALQAFEDELISSEDQKADLLNLQWAETRVKAAIDTWLKHPGSKRDSCEC